jgi:hypothetical protein
LVLLFWGWIASHRRSDRVDLRSSDFSISSQMAVMLEGSRGIVKDSDLLQVTKLKIAICDLKDSTIAAETAATTAQTTPADRFSRLIPSRGKIGLIRAG